MKDITANKEICKVNIWPNNGPNVVAITAFAMEGDQDKCLEAWMACKAYEER